MLLNLRLLFYYEYLASFHVFIGLLKFLFCEMTTPSLCSLFLSMEFMCFTYDFTCHLLMISIESVFCQSVICHFVFVPQVILKIFISRLAHLCLCMCTWVYVCAYMLYSEYNWFACYDFIFIWNFLYIIFRCTALSLNIYIHCKVMPTIHWLASIIIQLNPFTHFPFPNTLPLW